MNSNFISLLLLILCVPFLAAVGFLGLKHAKRDRGVTLLMVVGIVACAVIAKPFVPAGFTMAVLVFLRFAMPGFALARMQKTYNAHRYASARSWARFALRLWPRRHVRQRLEVMCALCDYRSGDIPDAGKLRQQFDGLQRRNFDKIVLILERRWPEFAELIATESEANRVIPPILVQRLMLAYWTGDFPAITLLYSQLLACGPSRMAVRMQRAAQCFILQITGEVEAAMILAHQIRESAPSESLDMSRATALWTSGSVAQARALLEPLSRHSAYWVRQEAATRLAHPPMPADHLPAELKALGAQLAHDALLAKPTPRLPVTITMIACLIIAYIMTNSFLVSLVLQPHETWDENAFILHLGALRPSLVGHGEIWRLASTLFLDTNQAALLINIMGLALIGSRLEQKLTRLRYVGLFLGAGILGNLGGCAWSAVRHQDPLIAGAGTAIMGLAGGLLAMICFERPVPHLRASLAAVVFVIVLQIGLADTVRSESLSAHLCGIIAGFVIATVLLRYDPPPRPTQ